MTVPAETAASQPTRRLDRKLASILAGTYTPADFIIADAKDADMAFGVTSAGPLPGTGSGDGGPLPHPGAYLDAMRAQIAQGDLDILLIPASNGAADGSLDGDLTLQSVASPIVIVCREPH